MLEGDTEKKTKEIFTECINRHKYNVLEFETNKDHMHLLVEVRDKMDLAAKIRTLKSVSAKELLVTPRFRGGNTQGCHRRKPVEGQRSFWATRYGSREIDESEIEDIKEYIRNQKNILHM